MSTYFANDSIVSRLTGPISDLAKRELERRWLEYQTNEILEKAMSAFDAASSRNAHDGEHSVQRTGHSVARTAG